MGYGEGDGADSAHAGGVVAAAAALITTRFAPSPTGQLHLGHAHAALVAWRAARAAGGRFLLRIEDIDPARCRAEFVDGIVADLRWLGLDWDGEVRVQSAHLAEYRAVLDALRARGLLYPCFCSRADIAAAASAPHDPYGVPRYGGACRGRADAAALVGSGAAYALRLDMGRALEEIGAGLGFSDLIHGRIDCDPARFGDVVLARKDAPASYHLCCAHDDSAQGVTLVTRAEDLLHATDIQRVLQALMGWLEPVYRHHALLVDAQGRRLSKRENVLPIAALRAAGESAAAVRAMALSPDG